MWAFLAELRVGTGNGEQSERRIDAWAINCYPAEGFKRVAYEVKVSRSDFLSEMRKPRKRRMALRLSNEYYFATPPGLIKPDELPPEAGLVELAPNGWIDVVVEAPFRETFPPTWRFLSAIVRRVNSEVMAPSREVAESAMERAASTAAWRAWSMANEGKDVSWEEIKDRAIKEGRQTIADVFAGRK